MANTKSNTTISGTNFGTATTLFDTAAGDAACSVYTIHNRDSTINVRVVVTPLHNPSDDGAVIPPGISVPFRAGANGITKVQVWAESGSPVVDGFVESRF